MEVDDKVFEDGIVSSDPIEHVDEICTAACSTASSDPTVSDSKSKIRSPMISRVAMSDAHFKHQQRGEPDLTFEEKSEIAENILKKSPSLFLSRFGQFLEAEDVQYFTDFRGDYEVDFYIKQVLKQQDKIHNQKVIKNRRYAAMQELMNGGDYFSDDEMKWRDPFLYEQMIGQHLSQEEIQGMVDKTDLRFSNILLKHMDQIQENHLFALQKETEECQAEEEEEESEEEEMSEEEDDNNDADESEKSKISEVEKQMLRAEFLRIMQEKFMSGKDKDFDYSTVDNNATYDSLDTLGKDAEEKYFDEEEPHRVNSPSVTDQRKQPNSLGGQSCLPSVDANLVKTSVIEGDSDYMTLDVSAEGDVTKATAGLTKMSVSCPDRNDKMLTNG